jgi:hypothetical protein
MDDITEDKLTETFDQLVAEGIIVYGPYESIKTEDHGYPVSNISG